MSVLVSDETPMSDSPANERLALRTDGASRGNPGPAAAGVVIEDSVGAVLFSVGVYLGEMPNNQAEYRALIFGLRAVAEFQPGAVDEIGIEDHRPVLAVRHDMGLRFRLGEESLHGAAVER